MKKQLSSLKNNVIVYIFGGLCLGMALIAVAIISTSAFVNAIALYRDSVVETHQSVVENADTEQDAESVYAEVTEKFGDVCVIYTDEEEFKEFCTGTYDCYHLHIAYAMIEELGVIPQGIYVDDSTGFAIFAYDPALGETLKAIQACTSEVCCEGCIGMYVNCYGSCDLPIDDGSLVDTILSEISPVSSNDCDGAA